MMTVWIVGVEDRHTDTQLTVYDTWVGASAAAERLLLSYGGPSEEDEAYGFESDDELLWLHRYSTEGDCVWVCQMRVQLTA